MGTQREDEIERLARRTAEENDRLARARQQEWLDASRRPAFPKWFLWVGLIAGIISLLGILMAFR